MNVCRYLGRRSVRHLSTTPYPNRSDFAVLTDKDIRAFEEIVGPSRVKGEDLEHYNKDWLNTVCGHSELVVTPVTVDQVSQVLRYCDTRRLAVVPQGGNTGLVGGSNPVYDEVVLSLEKLNRINYMDTVSGVVECEAGVILQSLSDYVSPHGFTVPLDLGARGTCQIGGNLATHAGGLRVIRYGQLRASVLGLRVVLPNGRVLDNMSRMRKDNTGYDLKQLFIGSEGTLGVITDVSLLLPYSSSSHNTALFACLSYQDVVSCYRQARKDLGEIVSACEFMDSMCMNTVQEKLGLSSPFTELYPFYFLVETSGSNEEHDNAKLESFMNKLFENELCVDGVVASSSDQSAHLMSLRESVSLGFKEHGFNYKYDVSLPTEQMYCLVEKCRERLSGIAGGAVCGGYGHLGDNNLHLNIATPQFDAEALKLLEPFVFEHVAGVRGSISSEHGIGFKKANFLKYSKGEDMINTMRMVKELFDPHGIMNPYKVLPW